MYSSDGKSNFKFQRRVSCGLPPESLEEKRRRILSGLSVISQKKRLGKKVTFRVAGYKPRSIRYSGLSGSRFNAVGLTQEKVNFRSQILASKVSRTSISHVSVVSKPQFNANPFFNIDLQGITTHTPSSPEVGWKQQILLKRKREANNYDKTIKSKISIKKIKTEYSELEILERCLSLEKECFEMLEYLQN